MRNKLQNTSHTLQSTSYLHCLVQPHLHMHQHTHQHAFTPILHQSSSSLTAPMGPQHSKFNTHIPRGARRPSFAPVPAFHRATQESFKSTKRGRWCALHVCIAWKIYYQEQLKKTQQKSNSLHGELTPENPASQPDSEEGKESDQPSCRCPDLDSPCGYSGKTAEDVIHFKRSYPSDLCASLPHHSRTTKREKVEQPQNFLHWREKHTGQRTDTAKALPLRDESLDRAVNPGVDGRHSGSLGRKRPLKCDGVTEVKRMKQDIVNDKLDSSKTFHTDPYHASLHRAQAQHLSDLSVLYPDVARTPGRLASYPGAEMHPYHIALWGPVWDIHKRLDQSSTQNALKVCAVNTCKAIKIPFVTQRQKEAYHGFFAQPLNSPLAFRQQEMVYLRGREFLHSHPQNCYLHCCRHQPPHSTVVATSYMQGP